MAHEIEYRLSNACWKAILQVAGKQPHNASKNSVPRNLSGQMVCHSRRFSWLNQGFGVGEISQKCIIFSPAATLA